MVMQIPIEDEQGRSIDTAELEEWADRFGLTFPVLYDRDGGEMWEYVNSSSVGLPYSVLIDRGMVITDTDYPTERDVRNLLGG